MRPPAYLERVDMYDLSCIADPQNKKSLPQFHSLDRQAWPSMERLGLDESQMQAFQLAITKELAIIQGPPGTGESLGILERRCCVRKARSHLQICFSHLLREDLRGAQDRSGSLEQSESLGQHSTYVGGVLH